MCQYCFNVDGGGKHTGETYLVLLLCIRKSVSSFQPLMWAMEYFNDAYKTPLIVHCDKELNEVSPVIIQRDSHLTFNT